MEHGLVRIEYFIITFWCDWHAKQKYSIWFLFSLTYNEILNNSPSHFWRLNGRNAPKNSQIMRSFTFPIEYLNCDKVLKHNAEWHKTNAY